MEVVDEVKKILQSGESQRCDLGTTVHVQELRNVEKEIGFTLPLSYRAFLELGGLSELRFHHRILSPSEILMSRDSVTSERLVPFADNGCGDLYCWIRDDTAEPAVAFADHETGRYLTVSNSFVDWLARNKF